MAEIDDPSLSKEEKLNVISVILSPPDAVLPCSIIALIRPSPPSTTNAYCGKLCKSKELHSAESPHYRVT